MIIAGVIVALVIIWCVLIYNKLISAGLKVDNQWSQIDVQLKRRADLLPNLVETVKGYTQHEGETLKALTDARARYLASSSQADTMQASTEMSRGLGRLLAVAENYPDLKASSNFLQLQEQLATLEKSIADYRQFYNDTVMLYNRQISVMPDAVIAKLLGYKDKFFWKAEEADRVLPSIKF